MSGASSKEKNENNAVRQLPLALPETPPRYDRDGYIRSESNAASWRAGQAWLSSQEPALIICGPKGAGKTHLAHVLAGEERGVFLDAAAFAQKPSSASVVVVDDLPAPSPRDFLTALESCIEAGGRIILSGAGHPAEWAGGLKDLRTRLEAMPRAALLEPDEPLIRAVIAKGFRERQVRVSPTVIEFAALRLPRTFSAAHAFVVLADRAALEEKRSITTPFVQKLLDNFSEGA